MGVIIPKSNSIRFKLVAWTKTSKLYVTGGYLQEVFSFFFVMQKFFVFTRSSYRQGNEPANLAFVVESNNFILIKSILNWFYENKILKKSVFWNVLKWGSKCHVTFAL